jgi:hypothetical protein
VDRYGDSASTAKRVRSDRFGFGPDMAADADGERRRLGMRLC